MAWGLVWVPIKWFGHNGLSGQMLLLASYGSVSLALLPWLVLDRRQWWPLPGSMWAVVLFGGWANFAFTMGLIEGSILRCTLLFYLQPVWAVIAARWLLGEHADGKRKLGVVIGLAGAWCILGGPAVLDSPVAAADLWAASAGAAYALSNVGVHASHHHTAAHKTAASLVGCALFALTGQLVSTEVAILAEASLTTLTGAFLYGLFWIGGLTWRTSWAFARLPVGRASLLMTVELVVALLSGAWLAGERLDGLALLGAAGILLAIGLELLPSLRRPAIA
jgi:drug/metabolite transporter (DMT)-like permease